MNETVNETDDIWAATDGSAGSYSDPNEAGSDGPDGKDATDAFTEGPVLLQELSEWFDNYVRTRLDCGPDLLAIWTLHTHLMDVWWSTPRLFVTSALPSCGKTTVLDHLERLTPNPMMGSQATPALIARMVSAQQTTVLLDETDNLLSKKKDGTPDLLATLNSGYRRGGNRPVLTPKKGGDWEAKQMSTFAAVALAGIGDHLPDAVLSRSITTRLDRAKSGEVGYSDWRNIEPEAHDLRDRVAEWAEANCDEIKAFIQTTKTPEDLHGRDLEVWEPIFILGSYIGNGWLEKAEACRLSFTIERDLDNTIGGNERYGLRLLKACREVWPDSETFTGTAALIDSLARHDPDSWGADAPYGQIKPRRLANLLVEFGIRSEHSSDKTKRGYYRGHFTPAWSIYLPTDPSANASHTSGASKTSKDAPRSKPAEPAQSAFIQRSETQCDSCLGYLSTDRAAFGKTSCATCEKSGVKPDQPAQSTF